MSLSRVFVSAVSGWKVKQNEASRSCQFRKEEEPSGFAWGLILFAAAESSALRSVV